MAFDGSSRSVSRHRSPALTLHDPLPPDLTKSQKVLGWFGGHGFTGTLEFFTGKLGIPVFFALLAMAAEFLGALGLITGALSRIAAFGVACVMLVAVFTVHAHNGFFMNWTGQQPGEGFEYHILAVALASIVLVKGGGAWSLDGWLSTRDR